MKLRPQSDERDRPHTPGVARVNLLVGGNNQATVLYRCTNHSDLVVYYDVPREIQLAVPGDPPPGTLIRPLARGKTVATLRKAGHGPSQRLLKNRPGITLDVGLRQLRALGYYAAEAEIESSDFAEGMRSGIVEPMLALHHGCISKFQLLVEVGGSGATGAGGGLAIAFAIAKVLLDCTDATVEIVARVIGSSTYLQSSTHFQLGPGVHRNAGLTAAEWLYHAGSSARHPREALSVTFAEYPPCGPFKYERDRYVLQATQARFCREVEDQLARMSVNHTVNSRIGAVAIERFGFGQPLPESEVAADVAAAFVPHLLLVLATRPNLALVKQIDAQRHSRPLPCLDIEHIIDRLPTMTADDVFNAVKKPDERTVAEVFLEFNDGNRVNLSHCKEIFATRCETTEEFCRRLILYRTAEVVLSHEITLAADELADAREEEVTCDRGLIDAIRLLKPQRFWHRLWGIWKSIEQRDDGLRHASEPTRDNLREIGRLEADYNALRDAGTQVREEIAYLEQRLNSGMRLLMQFLGSGGGGESRPAWVITRPIDELLGSLLDCPAATPIQAVLRLLGTAVSHITVAGLAYTLNSSSDRLEDLVPLLANAKPAVDAPSWGGRCDCDEPVVSLVVVPPLAPDIENKLREGFAKSDSTRILAVAESCAACVNVVHLSIYFPNSASTVVTSFLASHARQGMREDFDAHCPDGVNYLTKCGIHPSAEE